MKEQILNCLPPSYPWRGQLQWYDTIDSTNTHAKQLASQGAPEGTAVLAGTQTGGRGRMGRRFHSPAGIGIYMSLILRPHCTPAQLMHLTCAAGVAVCDALEDACGLRPGIKWINDLVHEGRKLGGILAEMSLNGDGTVAFAVIGIGLNCSQQPEDFPEDIRSFAGSLSMARGESVDQAKVAAAMLESLHRMSQRLLADQHAILDRYRADCVTLGKEVRLLGSQDILGIAEDVDSNGALLVRLPDGQRKAVCSGEVSVRGMYSYT